MHCSIVVPALHRWITTPHFYATLWFQRCSGGFQRPALMQHRRSSAALMDSDAPVGFQRHACGLQRVLLMQDLGSTVAGVVSSDPFFCIFQVQCRTGGFQRPKHRGSSPARLDSSASGLRNMCEQRSCTQDTSKQVLRRSLTACSQRQGATAVSAK